MEKIPLQSITFTLQTFFCAQRCNSCEEVILYSAILFSSSAQSAGEICDFP